MTREEWLALGRSHRWCSAPVLRDSIPVTEAEIEADDCVYVVRIYESPAVADAVEAT